MLSHFTKVKLSWSRRQRAVVRLTLTGWNQLPDICRVGFHAALKLVSRFSSNRYI